MFFCNMITEKCHANCAKLGAVTTTEDVDDTIAHPAHCSLQITVMYEVDKYFIHCYIAHT